MRCRLILLGSLAGCRCGSEVIIATAALGAEAGPAALVPPSQALAPLPNLDRQVADEASMMRSLSALQDAGLSHLLQESPERRDRARQDP